MTDLRALPIEERRQLAAEAERRARAGESPVAISAELGIARLIEPEMMHAYLGRDAFLGALLTQGLNDGLVSRFGGGNRWW